MNFVNGAFRCLMAHTRGRGLSRAAAAAAAAGTAAAATAASMTLWSEGVVAEANRAEAESARTPPLAGAAATSSSFAASALPPTSTPASSPSAASSSAHATSADSLPTYKLSCKARSAAPHRPVVLVSCGSFNPPTVLHLRMVDLAAEELMRRGYDVWGAYLSPVADAYGKSGLAPAADRVTMCRLAAAESETSPVAAAAAAAAAAASEGEKGSHDGSTLNFKPRSNPEADLVMVYDWEARQPGYTRTLAVLRRVESELRDWLQQGQQGGPMGPSGAPAAAAPAHSPRQDAPGQQDGQQQGGQESGVRAMLLCGGDVLASMASPGVWRDPDVILREHGVVCVDREGADLEDLLNKPGNVLYDNRDRIVVVYDKVGNTVSSSKVR
ncbi:hypothetical protein Agub_g5657, partial [Astrephomene gubernaculifera]